MISNYWGVAVWMHVPSQLCLADKGYQGFGKRHKGACLPTKKPRNQPLSEEDKQHHPCLSTTENSGPCISSVASRFFASFLGAIVIDESDESLRLNLIAGLLNYEPAHAQ